MFVDDDDDAGQTLYPKNPSQERICTRYTLLYFN